MGNDRRLETIMRELEGAVAANRDAVEELVALGGMYLKAGKRGRGWELLARATRERPHDKRVAGQIREVVAALGLDVASALGRIARAAPGSTALEGVLAEEALEAADGAKAQRHLNRLWRIEPEAAEGWINRGLGRALVGDWNGARVEFGRAVASDPENAEARFRFGEALLRLGRPEESQAQFERLIELQPRASVAHELFGNALRLQGKFQPAIEGYRLALRLDRRNVNARIGIIWAWLLYDDAEVAANQQSRRAVASPV